MTNSLTNTARMLGAGLRALLALTLVTGVVYPLVITGIAQGLINGQANGSEIKADGKVVGSSLSGRTTACRWRRVRTARRPTSSGSRAVRRTAWASTPSTGSSCPARPTGPATTKSSCSG